MPQVTLTVNGTTHTAEVEGRTLLVELLRETLRLTGTHVGCDTSQCGACVVHVDGESVKSCTLLALQATEPREFAWGEVWEWTASAFAPYPGFAPHPYRDYSQPWFDDGRRVLRGASFATAPWLRHPCYRNFFTGERTDVFAGFRSCARS